MEITERTVYVSKKHGKRYRVSRTFLTKKEAKLWKSQKELDKSTGNLTVEISENATFYTIFKKYLEDEIYNKSPNTIINYRAQIEKHVIDEIGMIQIKKHYPSYNNGPSK